MPIKRDYLIEKRNLLNEIRANSMTLQELRFFSIYLAKINARDPSTRIVRFTLQEFQRIMEFGRLNISQLKSTADSLLCKIIGLPLETGGFERFQLFKKCVFSTDENNEWYIEIDAHDDALPLMFEFKEKYFSYELWNALKLKSSNQLRMYEILKQYEHLGERVISVVELRELLGITPLEYPRFGDFKTSVLNACQKALEENTDIRYIYEPSGKRGKGGKVQFLRFYIFKNVNYSDQLSLDEFIEHLEDEPLQDISQLEDGQIHYMSEACGEEFDMDEVQVLYNLIIKIIPYSMNWDTKKERYDYLKRKYDEMKWRSNRTAISNRFGYLKTLVEKDMDL